MNNFDDFIASISEEDQQWILNGDDNSDVLPDDNAPEYLIRRSFHVSLRLLATYHQWMEKH